MWKKQHAPHSPGSTASGLLALWPCTSHLTFLLLSHLQNREDACPGAASLAGSSGGQQLNSISSINVHWTLEPGARVTPPLQAWLQSP